MAAIDIDLGLLTPPIPSSTDVVATPGAGGISVTYVGTPAYYLTVSLFTVASGGSSVQGPFTTTLGNSTVYFTSLSAGTYYVEYALKYTDSYGSTTGSAAPTRLSVVVSSPSSVSDLDDLSNVTITSPTNGQTLVYDSTDSTWKNGADNISARRNILQYRPGRTVDLATTSNITLSGVRTVDGVSTSAYTLSRAWVLVKNQTTATENGIYRSTSSGSWTRESNLMYGGNDFYSGGTYYVLSGTANGGLWFKNTNALDTAITVGSDNITFAAA